MSSINPSRSTLPSLASYFPQIASSFSNTQARADDSSESNVQIGNGFINNLTIGNNNTANSHIYLAASDSKLLETLMLQHIFALQPNTVPLVNLDLAIEELQKRYLEGLQEDNEVKDALSNYVAPEGMGLYDSTRFDLKSKVQDFLNSDKKVLLLLGEAGSGKSTFNRDLAVSLWEAYTQKDKTKDTPIPVFIGLSSLSGPDRNLVSAFFEKQGFSKEQIKELQSKYRFVLILDGFDEIEHRQQVFYRDNELDDWKGSKIIISSRPEYLGPNYQYKFHPPGERNALQEYRLAPFSDETIKRYIDCYSETYPHAVWSAERYKEALDESNLKELVSNPFLLKITLSVLPELSQRGQVKNQRLTRIAIYDQFVKSWFDRSQQRLNQILEVGSKERKEFKDLEREGFAGFGEDFSKELALEMYQAGEVITHYRAVTHARWKKNDTSTEVDWHKRLLSNEDTTTVLMRLNAPLICQDRPNNSGKEYRFIHKSLRDYFVARALWEELDTHNKVEPSFVFNTLNIVNDPAVLQFLAERMQGEPKLESKLLSVVEQSKGEDGGQFERGAANALTILVKSGVQLSNKDFNGIRVRGADLSYGVFDHTQFEGADLSGVKLPGAWLREANMSRAKLSGVEFGEKPALEVGNTVWACSYSPDGYWLAIATLNVHERDCDCGHIKLYQAQTLELKYIINAPHTSIAFSPDSRWLVLGGIESKPRLWLVGTDEWRSVLGECDGAFFSLAFSPDGQWFASANADKSIKLWAMETGELRYTLEGHSDPVRSVSISGDGKWLASGSVDKTVKLWELGSTGAVLRQTFEEHSEAINSVSISPDSKWLASASLDATVKLWELGSAGAVLRQTIKEYSGPVLSVSFSSNGKWLAFGSSAKTVKLLELGSTGAVLRQTFEGHSGAVYSMSISPDSKWLASGSFDKTVRLWELGSTAVSWQMLQGYSRWGTIADALILPDGKRLAFGCGDGTVKLWEPVSTGAVLRQTLEGHSHSVNKVSISPDGKWLASGSSDKTVKLWELRNVGAVLHQTLEGHHDEVWTLSFSPDGKWLASGCRDGTVKLWELGNAGAALRQTLEGRHHKRIRTLSFSPDGKWLVSGGVGRWLEESESSELSEACTLKLWKLGSAGAALHQTLDGHHQMAFGAYSNAVKSISISPDGKWLVSGSSDRTVKLWELGSAGAVLRQTLEGHSGAVESVSFSPDGKWLASGGADKAVKLWLLDTGECTATIPAFVGTIHLIIWQKVTEGLSRIVLRGSETMIRIFQLERKENDWKSSLYWTFDQNELAVDGLLIEDTWGLSPGNARLLIQKGANGRPTPTPDAQMLL